MKIKIKEWAENNFRPAPHRNTIVNWIKAGRISPAPVFIGRSYFVDENARYVGAERTAPPRPDLRKTASGKDPRKSLVDRINESASVQESKKLASKPKS